MIHLRRKDEVKSRLRGFKCKWKMGNEEEIFAELVFCLLTPQSKATSCWSVVEDLLNKSLILVADKDQLVEKLQRVRFRNRKAEYIIEARKQFSYNGKLSVKRRISRFSDVHDARKWLVHNVKGMGYKEASHFLRNIGFGEEIAILDRHILKNLKWLEVIEKIPTHLTKQEYSEIEGKMKEFAEKINIPMSHLDLLLWCKETGKIFK